MWKAFERLNLFLIVILVCVMLASCSLLPTETQVRSGDGHLIVGSDGIIGELPDCRSLTPSATAGLPATRTSTPNKATQEVYSLTPPPVMAPTWTLVSVDETVDMAPGFPDYSKYQVVVFRHNGTRQLWELGLWMDESVIPREDSDCQEGAFIDYTGVKFNPAPISRTVVPNPPRDVSLDHDHSPKAVLLEITSPADAFFNYNIPLANCYILPNLVIFGDGHGFYLDPQRGLLAGNIDYHPILNWLFSLHFFDPWILEMPATVPPLREIDVNLTAGSFSRGYYQESELIQQIDAMVKPDSLAPFIPEQAVLHAMPYDAYLSGGGFPEWPAGLSFSPEDTQYSHFTVQGTDLAIVWKGLQAQQTQVKGFNYKGRDWAVWLIIPGLMNDQGDCNPSPISTPMPTSTWFPYPVPTTPTPVTPVSRLYPYPPTAP